MRSNLSSERGAILVQVALAILTLIAFNVFVVDYGVMWAGRGLAQNAADAGALAGATALAFDDFVDRSDTGPAKTAGHEFAVSNWIWGQAPDNNIASDVTFPTSPSVCADNSCIRVDVYRNQQRGNALPPIFGLAAGVTSSGVKAMAIARAANANASDCLKPWAIPDKWIDNYDITPPIDMVWTPDDHFETVYGNGPNKGNPLPNPDVYTPPSQNSTGTGFTLANDRGVQLTLKVGLPKDTASPGNFLAIDLPRADGEPDTGGQRYRDNIANCNGVAIRIGDTLNIENGDMKGPTGMGVQDLIDKDPDAQWDPQTKSVINSCAQASPSCGSRSPRVVTIPLFNPAVFEAGRQTGKVTVTIVNMFGFFIDHMDANGSVVGYLTAAPGLVMSGTTTLNTSSSFLKTVLLVR